MARQINVPTEAIVRRQTAALRAHREMLWAAQRGDTPGVVWLSRQYDLEQVEAALRWIERTELVE